MAQTYIDEEEYGEALDFYSKAFQYPRNYEDYIPVPSLFEKMGDYKKATLAYLYLAKYQIKEGKVQRGTWFLGCSTCNFRVG